MPQENKMLEETIAILLPIAKTTLEAQWSSEEPPTLNLLAQPQLGYITL